MTSARNPAGGLLRARGEAGPARPPTPRGVVPRPEVEQRALAESALLMAGLGLGSALLAWALWARLGWAHPPLSAKPSSNRVEH